MFLRVLRNEFKRTFNNSRILFCYFLLICMFIGFSLWYSHDIPLSNTYTELNSAYIVFTSLFSHPAYSQISFVLSIIILMINGDSLYIDNVSDIFDYSVTRMSKNKYVLYKGLATSLCAFIGIFVGTLFCLLFCLVKFPMITPTNPEFAPIFARHLFMTNPILYILYYLIILGLFGSFVLTIANIVSIYNKKHLFITMVIPFVLILLYSIIAIYISCDFQGAIKTILLRYNPISMISEYIYCMDIHILTPLLYWLGLNLFSWIIYCFLYRKKLSKVL